VIVDRANVRRFVVEATLCDADNLSLFLCAKLTPTTCIDI